VQKGKSLPDWSTLKNRKH